MLKFEQAKIIEISSIQFTHIRLNYFINPKKVKYHDTEYKSYTKKKIVAQEDLEQAISIDQSHQIIGKQKLFLSALIGMIYVFGAFLLLTFIDHK